MPGAFSGTFTDDCVSVWPVRVLNVVRSTLHTVRSDGSSARIVPLFSAVVPSTVLLRASPG